MEKGAMIQRLFPPRQIPIAGERRTRFMAVIWNLNGTVVKSWYGVS
jgi:hypothetical protein